MLQWINGADDASHDFGSTKIITNIAAENLTADSKSVINGSQYYGLPTSTPSTTTVNQISSIGINLGDGARYD